MTAGERKCLGVIGGLGPMATAQFMELVIQMTQAETDQEHIQMIVYNVPSVPDRTAYLLDRTRDDPVPEMIRIGKALAQQGAEEIAMPCVTAHSFLTRIRREVKVPIINGITETVHCLHQAGVTSAGIMATDGTIATGFLQRALERRGIRAVIPGERAQQGIMSVIYDDIKADRPADMDKFRYAERDLREQGAQVIILGCTELPLLKREHDLGPGFLDTLEVLAQASVLRCGGVLKPRYRHLLPAIKQEKE